MRKLPALLALIVASATTGIALAASKAVTLDVPAMNCELCPITVKKALQKVGGVERVSVNYEKKRAKVTFDDTRTNVEALTDATRNAGYPASVNASK